MGVAGVHERGGKRFASNRGPQVASDGSEEVLTKLLHFSLHQATVMDHLQQGAVVVFVVVHEPMQQKLLEQVQLWDHLLPPNRLRANACCILWASAGSTCLQP